MSIISPGMACMATTMTENALPFPVGYYGNDGVGALYSWRSSCQWLPYCFTTFLSEGKYRWIHAYNEIKTILTIRHIEFQGWYAGEQLADWFGVGMLHTKTVIADE